MPPMTSLTAPLTRTTLHSSMTGTVARPSFWPSRRLIGCLREALSATRRRFPSFPSTSASQPVPRGTPSDLVLDHHGTDIICIGTVYAPHGKAIPTCDASVAP